MIAPIGLPDVTISTEVRSASDTASSKALLYFGSKYFELDFSTCNALKSSTVKSISSLLYFFTFFLNSLANLLTQIGRAITLSAPPIRKSETFDMPEYICFGPNDARYSIFCATGPFMPNSDSLRFNILLSSEYFVSACKSNKALPRSPPSLRISPEFKFLSIFKNLMLSAALTFIEMSLYFPYASAITSGDCAASIDAFPSISAPNLGADPKRAL